MIALPAGVKVWLAAGVLMAVEIRAFLAMGAVLSCGLSRAIRD